MFSGLVTSIYEGLLTSASILLYQEAKFDSDYFIPFYFLGSSHYAHNISAHFEQKQRHCDFRGRTGKKHPVLQIICNCAVMYAYVK